MKIKPTSIPHKENSLISFGRYLVGSQLANELHHPVVGCLVVAAVGCSCCILGMLARIAQLVVVAEHRRLHLLVYQPVASFVDIASCIGNTVVDTSDWNTKIVATVITRVYNGYKRKKIYHIHIHSQRLPHYSWFYTWRNKTRELEEEIIFIFLHDT